MKHTNKMGEQAILPKDNAANNQDETDQVDEDMNEEDNAQDDDVGDMSQEEFSALNNKMDELNSALDNIEQKNEVIYSELLKLLQANKEIRQHIGSQSSASDNTQVDGK